RSRVVLTPRCWRQVLEKQASWGDGGKRAVHRGELAISRKAIAQGRPECSRCPVCPCAFLFAQIARETAGAASTRSSLRPLFSGGGKLIANLGRKCAARSQSHIPSSSPALCAIAHWGGRPGIPETAVIESIGRGVLDTRMRGHDDRDWGNEVASCCQTEKLVAQPHDSVAFGLTTRN